MASLTRQQKEHSAMQGHPAGRMDGEYGPWNRGSLQNPADELPLHFDTILLSWSDGHLK